MGRFSFPVNFLTFGEDCRLESWMRNTYRAFPWSRLPFMVSVCAAFYILLDIFPFVISFHFLVILCIQFESLPPVLCIIIPIITLICYLYIFHFHVNSHALFNISLLLFLLGPSSLLYFFFSFVLFLFFHFPQPFFASFLLVFYLNIHLSFCFS